MPRVKPKKVIGIHDASLSDMGHEFAQKTLEKIAESFGSEAVSISAGDSIVVHCY